MNIRRVFCFFLFLVTSNGLCYGAPTAKVILSVPAPISPSEKGKCSGVFGSYRHIEKTWSGEVGERMGQSHFYGFGPFPSVYEAVPQMILQRWAQERGKSPEEIARIEKIDLSRDPGRTTSLGFAHQEEGGPFDTYEIDQAFSGFIVYDGSRVPLYNGWPRSGVSLDTHLLSFEQDLINQGYRLPERTIEELTGKPAYIWELGLVNVERGYEQGTHTLLGLLAREVIDIHYNLNQFNMLGQTHVLANNNLVIYAIGLAANVRVNRRLGFHSVYRTDTREIVQTSNGRYLMKINALDLMRLYSDEPFTPIRRNETRAESDKAMEQHRNEVSNQFTRLQESAPNLETRWDYLQATYRLGVLHNALYSSNIEPLRHNPNLAYLADVDDGPDVQFGYDFEHDFLLNRHIIFFEAYYQLAYAYMSKAVEEDPSLSFDHLIDPYRMMVNNFFSGDQMYEAFQEGQREKTLIPVYTNPQDLRAFRNQNREKLNSRVDEMEYLRHWIKSLD